MICFVWLCVSKKGNGSKWFFLNSCSWLELKLSNDHNDEVGDNVAAILNGLDKSRLLNELIKQSWLVDEKFNWWFENKQGIDVVHGESNWIKDWFSKQKKKNNVHIFFRTIQSKQEISNKLPKINSKNRIFLRFVFENDYRLVDCFVYVDVNARLSIDSDGLNKRKY